LRVLGLGLRVEGLGEKGLKIEKLNSNAEGLMFRA
jgi:hypothetical protein